MLLDFGAWGEFFVIILSAFVLLGPREMPRVISMLAKVYRWAVRVFDSIFGQAKAMADNYDLVEYQKEMHQRFKDDIKKTFADMEKKKRKK